MRRSIRQYDTKPLDEKVIAQLMDIVRWAPTARNGLPVKWIVVNGREKVHELAGLIVEWLRPIKGMESLAEAWDGGGDPILRGAPCLVVAYTEESALWPIVDTAIAVETLDLCATAMRLGSCWAGYFVRAAQSEPAINRWLGLTEKQTVHGGLMIGHINNEVYRRIPHRPELDLRWIR
jgi:nitroreductase